MELGRPRAATALTLIFAAMIASPAAALERPLLGPALAMLRFRNESASAIVIFRSPDSLREPADPRCPSETSLRLVAAEVDTGEIALLCNRWRKLADSFVYRDRSGTAGAVRAVVIGGGRLVVWLRLNTHDSLREASTLEVQLSVGSDRYCGRLEAPDQGPLSSARRAEACQDIWPRPNFIVINLDDARFDGVGHMAAVHNLLAGDGARFENAFTPNSICCPSRASLLTGLYSINHRTLTIFGSIGGAHRLRENGGDHETIAVWLSDAGYETGLFGKYLNDYNDPTEGDKGPGGSFYLPPGWSRWWAMLSPPHYGGIHGDTYEVIEEDGERTLYDDHSSDDQYSTDLSARKLREFVADAVRDNRPFFAYWSPFAPHIDDIGEGAVPADRHQGLFAFLRPWRPPSWNEEDVSDKPGWVRDLPILGTAGVNHTDIIRQRSFESLVSVNEQIVAIIGQLVDLGIDRDTAIFLTSDNGVSWGEHRWFSAKKGCPYEECQRVPLVVRYPRRVQPGTLVQDTAALNIDLPPTIAELAGVEIPVSIDGVSLVPALLGLEDANRRTDYLMEHWRVFRSSRLMATGMISEGDTVRLFYGDPLASPREFALFEFDDGDGVNPGATAVLIVPADRQATLVNLRNVVVEIVPDVLPILYPGALEITDLAAEHHGVIWRVDVDQRGILHEAGPPLFGGGSTRQIPDYLGVRDVLGGYTWVEYETDERELYDLFVDPFQLENLADDPDYQEIRGYLEDRLRQLRHDASVNVLPEPVSDAP